LYARSKLISANYRNPDVSIILKELAKRLKPQIMYGMKARQTRAKPLADIYESIKELEILPREHFDPNFGLDE
jgi:oligoribonuclease (3'-5' exoribonuclease)